MESSRPPRLLSGMKPSGRLHLGNLEGALRAWVQLQDRYETFCFIADWHAYTSHEAAPERISRWTVQLAAEYIASGLDPGRSTIFVQSDVPEHAELYLILSLITPVARLERIPTYKDVRARRHAEGPSHGLLGYPVLQAADVLLYGPEVVPVGRDQEPHLELSRELARRFNRRFGPALTEPAALLTHDGLLPGLDGRKMSKSYDNAIYLSDSPEATARKIMNAYTTPTKIRVSDPGVPETCAVCQLRRVYDPEGWRSSWEEDRQGGRGCVQNKRELIELVNAALAPVRARLRELEAAPDEIERILAHGAAKARVAARATLAEVRHRMGLSAEGRIPSK